MSINDNKHRDFLNSLSKSNLVLIEKVRNIFREFLKRKNLKITRERDRIVEFIFTTDYHFDVEILEKKLQMLNIATSRATIYRTLDLLVESKLIDRIHLGGTRYFYEPTYGQPQHYHLICKICQKIIEFIDTQIYDLQYKICKKYDFYSPEHHFKIFAICEECHKNQSKD